MVLPGLRQMQLEKAELAVAAVEGPDACPSLAAQLRIRRRLAYYPVQEL